MPLLLGMKRPLLRVLPALVISWGLLYSPAAEATSNEGYIIGGTAQTVMAPLEIPKSMMEHTARSFPFGLATGAIAGSFRAIGGMMNGALNVARGAAPYAKYMVFFI